MFSQPHRFSCCSYMQLFMLKLANFPGSASTRRCHFLSSPLNTLWSCFCPHQTPDTLSGSLCLTYLSSHHSGSCLLYSHLQALLTLGAWPLSLLCCLFLSFLSSVFHLLGLLCFSCVSRVSPSKATNCSGTYPLCPKSPLSLPRCLRSSGFYTTFYFTFCLDVSRVTDSTFPKVNFWFTLNLLILYLHSQPLITASKE